MKFVLLIYLKLPTAVNYFLVTVTEHGNFSAYKNENANLLLEFSYLLAEKITCSTPIINIKMPTIHIYILAEKISCSAELSTNLFYNRWVWSLLTQSLLSLFK